MENATDALKMAAAMLIFVGALTLTIAVFTNVRKTSAAVIENSDKNKTFYDNLNYSEEREVGIETVITNCYLYFKNYNTILFYVGKKNADGSLEIVKKLPLYSTESIPVKNVATNGNDKINSNLLINNENGDPKGSREIYGLDLNDEKNRNERWILSEKSNKEFVTSLIKNEFTEGYDWSRDLYNKTNKYDNHKLQIGFTYTANGLKDPFADAKKAKFIERIGTYKYSNLYNYQKEEDEIIYKSLNSTNFDGTQTQYIDSNNQVVATMENEDNSDLKRVIQYIYIGDE